MCANIPRLTIVCNYQPMAADDEQYDDDDYQADNNPDVEQQFGQNYYDRNDDNNGDNVQQPQTESDNKFKGIQSTQEYSFIQL